MKLEIGKILILILFYPKGCWHFTKVGKIALVSGFKKSI